MAYRDYDGKWYNIKLVYPGIVLWEEIKMIAKFPGFFKNFGSFEGWSKNIEAIWHNPKRTLFWLGVLAGIVLCPFAAGGVLGVFGLTGTAAAIAFAVVCMTPFVLKTLDSVSKRIGNYFAYRSHKEKIDTAKEEIKIQNDELSDEQALQRAIYQEAYWTSVLVRWSVFGAVAGIITFVLPVIPGILVTQAGFNLIAKSLLFIKLGDQGLSFLGKGITWAKQKWFGKKQERLANGTGVSQEGALETRLLPGFLKPRPSSLSSVSTTDSMGSGQQDLFKKKIKRI